MSHYIRADGRFAGRDIISVRHLSPEDLEYIFRVSHDMRMLVGRIGSFDLCRGKILANLFYEPSTRTSASFVAAMERLGGSVIGINEVHYSSVAKGESLPDTVRTLECYADVLVLRHPEVGAAAEAAKWCKKPVINAGDGVGEHPTQALLDLFTILEELGGVSGLTVTLLGDLRNGRTVHSLARLLAGYNVRLQLVSPPSLAMPAELLSELDAAGVVVETVARIEDAIPHSDVVYATRVQKERFAQLADYEAVKDAFCITPETMQKAKKKMVLLHPLPRVNEIAVEVDDDPRAAYFRQIEYGLYVRMALLAMVLGRA
jgi:aspartate carbamoyltransferase